MLGAQSLPRLRIVSVHFGAEAVAVPTKEKVGPKRHKQIKKKD